MESKSGRSLRAEPVMNQAPAGLGHAVTVSNANVGGAELDVQTLRWYYVKQREASYPCDRISCTYPLERNCDCFNSALVKFIAAKAIEARQGGGEDAVHESAVTEGDLP